jgi:hypothetical protein
MVQSCSESECKGTKNFGDEQKLWQIGRKLIKITEAICIYQKKVVLLRR